MKPTTIITEPPRRTRATAGRRGQRSARRLGFEIMESRVVLDATLAGPLVPIDQLPSVETGAMLCLTEYREQAVNAPEAAAARPLPASCDLVFQQDEQESTADTCPPQHDDSTSCPPESDDSTGDGTGWSSLRFTGGYYLAGYLDSHERVYISDSHTETPRVLQSPAGAILLPASPTEYPQTPKRATAEVEQPATFVPATTPATSAKSTAAIGSPKRYFSGQMPEPLSWSVRSEVLREAAPALAILSPEQHPATDALAVSVPHDNGPGDELREWDRGTGLLTAYHGPATTMPSAEPENLEDWPSAAAAEPEPATEFAAQDAVFDAIAQEAVWAAGLLHDSLSNEAAWVIVGAMTVTEIVRTRRSTQQTPEADEAIPVVTRD